jgi:pimeloyl-ACP methyl ester carboxylesterase
MTRFLVGLLSLTLLSSGCVRTRHFRYVEAQKECFSNPEVDPLPGVPGESRLWPSLDCRQTLYTVGYIEFDEDGKAIDRLQGTKALRLIEEARKRAPGGKIITVVYVHGWKNNASEAQPGGKPKDVEKFRSALAELGYRSRQAAGGDPPIPVVGVYMAWRGKSLMGPGWFNFLSVWGRRNSANRVGEGEDFASSLRSVIDKVNEKAGGKETGSRVMLVGHSFGARVLEHAIEMRDIQLYRPIDGATAVEPIVDLALYVNSANDARLSMARLQKLRANPIEVRHPDYDPADCAKPGAANTAQCRQYPLIVAVTSRGDLATKYLLPTVNTINLDKSVPIPSSPAGTFLDPTPSSRIYRRAAAAHMKFLQSHVVREVACPAGPPPTVEPTDDRIEQERIEAMVAAAVAEALGKQAQLKTGLQKDAELKEKAQKAADAERQRALEAMLHPTCDAGDVPCRFVFRTQDDHPVCFQADERNAVAPDKTSTTASLLPFNTTAFWIMDVDPAVIKDHGDIWNLSFVEMLAQLMAPRGFFEPRVGRVQLRAAPVR